MNCANSIRQGQIVALIKEHPGITKRELMALLGLSMRALEMHLTRIAGTNQAHSVEVPGHQHRAWYAGQRPEPQRMRIASVFDLAGALAA